MAVRVHTLAKELNVKSKAILEKCQAEGLDIKNHMSVLSVGLEATIREWFSEGAHLTTQETAERVNLEKVKAKPRRRKKKEVEEETPEAEASQIEGGVEEVATVEAVEAPEAKTAETQVSEVAEIEEVSAEPEVAEVKPEVPVEEKVEEKQAAVEKAEAEEPAEAPETKEEAVVEAEAESVEEETPKEPIKPVGKAHVPAPAKLTGPRVIRVERPEPVRRPSPRPARRSPEPAATDMPIPVSDKTGRRGKAGRGAGGADDEAGKGKGKKGRARVNPRRRTSDGVEQLREWRDRDLLERSQRLAAAKDHPQMVRKAERRHHRPSTIAPKQEKVQISEPIVLKDFCAATGISFNRIFPKLMEMGVAATINQGISSEQAEELAMSFEIELEIVKQKSRYEELVETFNKRDRGNVELRPPIVTFLGHVDHGKTSLLDRLRHSRVAQGEAGGITQHIGAYRYDKDGHVVVFLDTPGHEAFTALRARGAQMTDIVVLVVAADDGVMPQTIEAISHAKAAGVPIVVALNKVDLPNADYNRIYGQLSEHELLPAEWGGETDIIKTSAVTGDGLDDLIEHLYTLSELLDLKADPNGPATGIVIEARQDTSRGPVAAAMIQEGRLKVGDVVVAGRAFGKVRAMFDDMGKSIKEAGPATPVELLGLDEVPEAGERFHNVDDLQTAKDIAEEKRNEDQRESWTVRPKVTLENIFQHVDEGEVKQLNVIIRADTQGSVDVLKTKLEELSTSEVKIRILHAGTGGVTEGDIILAEASGAIVIGFGVVADDSARNKAGELDVEIRTYTVIYHLLEDVTAALEGLLEPTYEQNIKGRATVREVFKVTKVGTVAGCMVNDGVIERSAKIRVIRQNVIIREDATLDSLKRFKDDAREVRQGFECGMKIAGFDDVKEDDVIEAYEMVQVARKLETSQA